MGRPSHPSSWLFAFVTLLAGLGCAKYHLVTPSDADDGSTPPGAVDGGHEGSDAARDGGSPRNDAGTSATDAAPDAALDAGDVPDAGADEVDASSGVAPEPWSIPRDRCEVFHNAWFGFTRACSGGPDCVADACARCWRKVERECSQPRDAKNCTGSVGCANRHCMCLPGAIVGDCAARPEPDDMCECLDSCLTPGESDCRSAWEDHITCVARLCESVCQP